MSNSQHSSSQKTYSFQELNQDYFIKNAQAWDKNQEKESKIIVVSNAY